MLTVKWDVKIGAVEGDNSEAVQYERRGLKRSIKPSLFAGAARGFSMTDAVSHLREAWTPSTAKDVLEAAATHYVHEMDDILHTFACFERYYIYGLGLSKRAARRSARRAVLGVESSETTLPAQKLAGNPAISDVLQNSSANLLLHANAEQRAAEEAERLKALEDGSGEEPVPEDAAGPEPAEGLANVLLQLEHHLLPYFHRVVAKQLKLDSIPSEDPFEKKKARPPPQQIIVPKESAAPAKEAADAAPEVQVAEQANARGMGAASHQSESQVGSPLASSISTRAEMATLEGGDEGDCDEIDLTGDASGATADARRPAKTPQAPAL